MTPNQKRAFDAIKDLIIINGYTPSYTEIAARAGIKGRGQIHGIMKTLERDGLIVMSADRYRSIQLTGSCPTCGRSA